MGPGLTSPTRPPSSLPSPELQRTPSYAPHADRQRSRQRPALRIRTKLLLLILALLTIPWMGYKSVREMESFLLEGQRQALELTAEGIASLLSGRQDLFSGLVGVPEVVGLAYHPIPTELKESLPFEASGTQWAELLGPLADYTGSGSYECGTEFSPESFWVRHAVGISDEYFYALFDVVDDIVIYRDPDRLKLDHSDQVRLTLESPGQSPDRYLLLSRKKEGRMSMYSMEPDWRTPLTGDSLTIVAAEFKREKTGYTVRIRIPEDFIGKSARLFFEVIDVDDQMSREIRTKISTSPVGSEHVGQVHLTTPKLAELIRPLHLRAANITIWDKEYRVRAQLGSIFPEGYKPAAADRPDMALLDQVSALTLDVMDWLLRIPATDDLDSVTALNRLDEPLLQHSMREGKSVSELRRHGGAKVIAAAQPIWAEDKIIGSVLIKQSGNRVATIKHATLSRFVILFLSVFLFLAIAIGVFATRLTYRVTRLQRETEQATTTDGRLLQDYIRSGTRAGDELGNLTRSISSMLQNLGQYTRYLEKLPDTLAHEMNNPLNVVASSLDYLEYQHRNLVDDKYLNRARSGIFRLRTILTSLTEAANLKEALRNEQSDEERFNLVELVTGCVDGYQLSNPSRAFLNHVPTSPALIHGTPDRIAQLLDKLIDNAVQFGRERSAIIVRVNELPNIIQLSVINDGPSLPTELSERVFDPMVSSSTDARHSHLGLGLYIVREIAEFHGATVTAKDRGDANGVEVTVSFPK